MTLEDNKLSKLSNDFSELEHLVHLNLGKNNFTEIPIQLTEIFGLKYCSLKGNFITMVNEEILKNIQPIYKLDLDDNPLINIKCLEVFTFGFIKCSSFKTFDFLNNLYIQSKLS